MDFALIEMTTDQLAGFLDFLRSRLGDLYDDIEAEIITETGMLVVEESIRNEASVAIHRCFGSSKRFSESDKRNVTDVLASKMQMTKLLWKSRMNVLLQENQALKDRHTQRELSIASIQAKIDSFLKRNEFKLFDFMVDLRSTTQALMVDEGKQDQLQRLGDSTTYVIQKFTRALMERETSAKDIDNVRALLKADKQKSLFLAIQAFTTDTDKKMQDMDREIKTLKRRIIEFEDDIDSKNKEIDNLMEELETLKEKAKKVETEEVEAEVINLKIEEPVVKQEAVEPVKKTQYRNISARKIGAKAVIKTKAIRARARAY